MGKAEAGLLAGIISGNIGLAIGLVITAFGFYQALVEQKTWGWVMIIGGLAITAWPGLFKGAYNALNPVASTFTGGGYSRPGLETF